MARTLKHQFSINHFDAAKLIAANGSKLSYVLEGEPGIGKSSVLHSLKEQMGDKYDYIYVDVPNKDIPNIALSMPDHATQTTKDFVHTLWLGTDKEKPKVIMLDEMFKGGDYVKLMMNRLLLEHMVGDYQLPEGSIVFGTTNLQTDGVGDRSNAHTNSRIVRLFMRKPTKDEWYTWAIKNKIHGDILMWVQQDGERLFDSYTNHQNRTVTDAESPFHYIFEPSLNNSTYVAPRTLRMASDQLHNQNLVGRDLTITALAGTIGEKAALDLQVLVDLGLNLPGIDEIIKNPTKTRVPEKDMEKMILMYRSLNHVTDANSMEALITYLKRYNRAELVMTWLRSAVLRPDTADFVMKNKQACQYVSVSEEGSFLWRSS